MVKEIKVLGYNTSANLGDHIQSLATIHTLKKLGFKHAGFVDRSNPSEVPNGTNLLVNGFIRDNTLEMKVDGINLIYNNLHIDATDEDILAKRINIMRSHQPIGCRDRYTTNLLKQAGLEVFFNYCLTLMFDRRKKAPINGKVFFVDVNEDINLPIVIKRNKIHHIAHEDHILPSFKDKMKRAQEILDLYRNEARLVMTSRLHCALPCIAMGVPVILLASHEYNRLALAEEFIPLYKVGKWGDITEYGRKISSLERSVKKLKSKINKRFGLNLYYGDKIDRDPKPLDIRDIQEKVLSKTKEQILRFI